MPQFGQASHAPCTAQLHATVPATAAGRRLEAWPCYAPFLVPATPWLVDPASLVNLFARAEHEDNTGGERVACHEDVIRFALVSLAEPHEEPI